MSMYLGGGGSMSRPGPSFVHEHNDFFGERHVGPARRLGEIAGGRSTDAVGTLYEIPDNDKGTEATLDKMAELSWKGRNDPVIIKAAMQIVAEVPRKQYVKEMEQLFRFAQGTHKEYKGLRYCKDGYHVERVVSPKRTLEFGAGDCDDLSVWLAAALMAIGHGPVRFVVVAADAQRPEEFSHVYAWVRHPEGHAVDPSDNSRWIPLDPTVSKPFGWEVDDAFRKSFIEIGE